MIRFEPGINIWWGDITAIVAQKGTKYWGVFVYGRHSGRILVSSNLMEETAARELADTYAEKWLQVLIKERKANPQERVADTLEKIAEAETEGEDWKKGGDESS